MIDEKTIMGIVGVIILMGVAMFMVVTISDQPQMKEGFDNIYTVANPHTTNSFTVTNGLTGIEVYKYNGVRWELVDSGYVTYSGSTVTVTNGGLD